MLRLQLKPFHPLAANYSPRLHFELSGSCGLLRKRRASDSHDTDKNARTNARLPEPAERVSSCSETFLSASDNFGPETQQRTRQDPEDAEPLSVGRSALKVRSVKRPWAPTMSGC